MSEAKIPALVFSRVAGYFAPVYNGDKPFLWNKGKTEEYNCRVPYKIPDEIKSIGVKYDGHEQVTNARSMEESV